MIDRMRLDFIGLMVVFVAIAFIIVYELVAHWWRRRHPNK